MNRALYIGLAFALGCGTSDKGAEDRSGGAGGPSGWGGAAGGYSGQAGSSSAASLPIEQFVLSYVSAVCDHIGSCCARGGYSFDASACKSDVEQYAQALVTGALADPPRSTYDPAAGAACVSLTTERGEHCVLEPLPEPDPCAQMFVGLLTSGEPCTAFTECALVAGSSVTCAASPSDPTARCTAEPDPASYPRAALGEACSATCTPGGLSSVQCRAAAGDVLASCHTNDGVYCSSSSTCAPLPAIGEPCGSRSYCAEGAFCDSGVCAARRETGPCTASDACVATAYCNQSGQCVAKAADGAACAAAETCASGACNQGVCGEPLLVSQESCFSN
jgi:hypothetical protein